MTRWRRADWLVLGGAQLREHGPSGLTIEALCKASGRTRGSFYHHFTDHGSFVEALVRDWAQRQTEDVIALADAAPEGARGQALHDLVQGLDHGLESAIRTAARRQPVFAQEQARVDNLRLDYLTKLLVAERGMTPKAARKLAETEYAVLVGSVALWPDRAPLSVVGLLDDG